MENYCESIENNSFSLRLVSFQQCMLTISITSEHLEVEESINCQRDALTLTALAPNKKQIGRFCGEKGTIQQEIKSDANDVIIVFKQGLQLELENSIFRSQ